MLQRVTSRRFWIVAAYAALFAVIAGVQAWTAANWSAHFNSDEALMAIIAKHMSELREFPVYFYNVRYGGTLPCLITVPFFWLLGATPLAVRIAVVVQLMGFYALHALWMRHRFGHGAALLSLLVLSVPGFAMLSFLNLLSSRMGTYLMLWMLCLLMADPVSPIRLGWRWRSALFGLCAGLMFWTQPVALSFLAALPIPFLMAQAEWGSLRALAGKIVPGVLWPLITIGLGYFAITQQYAGRSGIVGAMGAAAVLAMFLVSKRKAIAAQAGALLLAGAAVGTSPQWILWIRTGIGLVYPYSPGEPKLENFRALVDMVLPIFVGLRPLRIVVIHSPEWQQLLAVGIGVIVLGSLCVFAWSQRHAIGRILMLKQLSREQSAVLIGMLLVAVPILAHLPVMPPNESNVRYLAAFWQGLAIVIALAGASLWRRFAYVTCIGILLWIAQSWYVNGKLAASTLSHYEPNVPHAEELERYLTEQGATTGFADYWTAYVVDFLSQERLQLHYYAERIPRYPLREGSDTRLQAYVMLPEWHPVPEGMETAEALANSIDAHQKSRGLISREQLDEIAAKKFVSRKRVAQWDVWILQNPAPSEIPASSR